MLLMDSARRAGCSPVCLDLIVGLSPSSDPETTADSQRLELDRPAAGCRATSSLSDEQARTLEARLTQVSEENRRLTETIAYLYSTTPPPPRQRQEEEQGQPGGAVELERRRQDHRPCRRGHVQAGQGRQGQGLHPDRPLRRHHPRRQRRLPVAQVRPEGDARQPVPESLLPLRVRTLLPREEEGAEERGGQLRAGGHVRGRAQPPVPNARRRPPQLCNGERVRAALHL
uniref:Uncharacterized protein n=1 Tax=Zea mays TaxID=4577 RepID=A0A804MNA1_MAIZE